MKGFRGKVLVLSIFIAVNLVLVILKVVHTGFFSSRFGSRGAMASTAQYSFERGRVLDRNSKELAVSIRQNSIAINPRVVREEKFSDYTPLFNLLNISEKKFEALLEKSTEFVWLKRKVDDEVVSKIRTMNLHGIIVRPEYRRFYPNQNLACHVIGCVNVDNKGLEGIEHHFNEELSGSSDDLLYQKKKTKESFPSFVITGKSLVLTIDRFIQHIVETELGKVYSEYKPASISAIVIDPNTGEVLAMANLPDYDPNNFHLFSQRSLKNFAVTDFYEPGSTFKIFSMAAFLERDMISLNETYHCGGGIMVGGTRIKCWKDHGDLHYRDVLRYSCNVGIINLALELPPKFFYSLVRNFGFGTLTGIELPGESRGLLRQPHQWTFFSRASVSIGQEIGVTPIQLLSAISAVANGGILYQPHIVKRVQYDDGTLFKEFPVLSLRQAIDAGVAARLTSLLIPVTEKDGSGEHAGIEGFKIAGKTGTAQVFDNKNNRYFSDRYIVSFAGYYPALKPRVAMLIVVREPKELDPSGGKIAAPVFRSIALKINSYMNIMPVQEVLRPDPESELLRKENSEYRSKPPVYSLEVIPDFMGYDIKQCLVILNNAGLTPNFIGTGNAYKQYPPAGSKVERKVPVTVWFREK